MLVSEKFSRFVLRLLKYPRNRICNVLDKFLMVLCVVVAVSVTLKFTDDHLLHIVEDFQIESVVWNNPNELYLYGTLDKVRQCTPLDVVAMVDDGVNLPYIAPMSFPDNYIVFSRPAIPQSWGPWIVSVEKGSVGNLTLFSNHRCHFLWDTTTELTTISLEDT